MTQALNWSPFVYAHRVVMELDMQGALDTSGPISIDAVAQAVKRVSSVSEIEFIQLDMGEISVKALTLIYERPEAPSPAKFARIAFSSDLSAAWRRFAVCKELCQILLSENATSRTRQRDEVQLYLEGLSDPIPPHVNEAVATEWLSTFCAMEVLCPLPLREPLFAGVRAGRVRLQDVAHRFQAPEVLVEVIFSEPYHAIARHYLRAEPLPGWTFVSSAFLKHAQPESVPQSFSSADASSRYSAMRTRRRMRKRVSLSSVELLNQLYDERSS